MDDQKSREHAYDRQWLMGKIDDLALGPADHNAKDVGARLATFLAKTGKDAKHPDRLRAEAALLAMAAQGCAHVANHRFRALGSLIGKWAGSKPARMPEMLAVRTRDAAGALTGEQSHRPVLQLDFGMLAMKYDEIESNWRALGKDMAFIRNLLKWQALFPQAHCPMDVIDHFNLDYQNIDFERVAGMAW